MSSCYECLDTLHMSSKKENILFGKEYLVLYNKIFGGDYNRLF